MSDRPGGDPATLAVLVGAKPAPSGVLFTITAADEGACPAVPVPSALICAYAALSELGRALLTEYAVRLSQNPPCAA